MLLNIRNFHAPAELAGVLIERNEVIVRCLEEEPVAINADAAIADVNAALGLPTVVPEFATGAGIHGERMVGHGEVKNTIDFERGGFHLDLRAGTGIGAISPGEREILHVGGIDLGQRAEAPAGVITVISGPGIGRLPLQLGGVETFRSG